MVEQLLQIHKAESTYRYCKIEELNQRSGWPTSTGSLLDRRSGVNHAILGLRLRA